MNAFKKYYLLVVIILAISGVALQHYSSDLELSYQKMEIVENGQIITKELLKPKDFHPLLAMGADLLKTAAVGIFISMFILVKIEKEEKEKNLIQLQEFQKRINVNIFDSLFQTLMPTEIYAIIKSQIIINPLVRKNAIWVYDFEPLLGGGFQLTQTLKSELHNIGNTLYNKHYPITFKTHEEVSSSRLEKFKYEYENKIIEVDTQSDDFKKEGGAQVLLEIPAGRHADITLIIVTKYKENGIVDSYYSSQALINATLIVTHPTGYSFTIFDGFSSEMKKATSDRSTTIFELKGAILPGQGMTFYLTKDIGQQPTSIPQ